MSDEGQGRSVGYVRLLGGNRNFRYLWTGQFISQMGDWFNSVALFTLILSLTGSGEAVGFILILKLLPTFFVGPLAGVAADRFDRKTIMIVTDVARGLSVLGFLFVKTPDQVWMVYALTVAQVILSTFFDPAKSAAVPNIVSRDELIAANGLSGASWSLTLALGAALGGVVTDAFGRDTAFIIDAASYFVSALFILAVRFPAARARRARSAQAKPSKLALADATGIRDLIEGARYLRRNPRVMAVLLVKSGWGLGGGVLLLLTIFGKQIFPIGRDGSTSIGLLYAARGIGALIGPVVASSLAGRLPRRMRRVIGIAFFITAAFYLLFAQAPTLMFAALFAVGAHAGGSIQWVYSTALLQMSVPDRFLGRVFALELAMVTLTMSLSTYFTGWGIDHGGFSPRQMATILGLAFLVPGILWLLLQPWLDKKEPSEDERSESLIEAEPVAETSFPPG
ncbi:MAG TPA: MFS transporter [Blastocatellia bacterium]|nr:MFS transporter [Blastocatellia bacterium]